MIAKRTIEELGIDPDAQEWQRSGAGAGAIEVAFGATGAGVNNNSHGPAGPRDGDWILMRVADDPARRVLVFDRNEWECFIDGARNGEFDEAARPG